MRKRDHWNSRTIGPMHKLYTFTDSFDVGRMHHLNKHRSGHENLKNVDPRAAAYHAFLVVRTLFSVFCRTRAANAQVSTGDECKLSPCVHAHDASVVRHPKFSADLAKCSKSTHKCAVSRHLLTNELDRDRRRHHCLTSVKRIDNSLPTHRACQ